MITLDDIEDMCSLTREEIAAVAEHEHLPDLDAAAKAEALMASHHGPQEVQRMICDDIREALHADNVTHARELFAVLRHYMSEHPEAARGSS